MWEEAIILGKELAEQYENEMFDFEQLSASLVSNKWLVELLHHVINRVKRHGLSLLSDIRDAISCQVSKREGEICNVFTIYLHLI